MQCELLFHLAVPALVEPLFVFSSTAELNCTGACLPIGRIFYEIIR
jgi:hypothetical protein